MNMHLNGAYKASKCSIVLNEPDTSAKFFREIWDKSLIKKQEQVYVILLDFDLHPLKWKCMHTGGVCEVVIDIRLIMKYAVKSKASAVMIAHNHPNHSIPSASETDKQLTNDLVAVCDLLRLKFLDHIILAGKFYFSFKNAGMLK